MLYMILWVKYIYLCYYIWKIFIIIFIFVSIYLLLYLSILLFVGLATIIFKKQDPNLLQLWSRKCMFFKYSIKRRKPLYQYAYILILFKIHSLFITKINWIWTFFSFPQTIQFIQFEWIIFISFIISSNNLFLSFALVGKKFYYKYWWGLNYHFYFVILQETFLYHFCMWQWI